MAEQPPPRLQPGVETVSPPRAESGPLEVTASQRPLWILPHSKKATAFLLFALGFLLFKFLDVEIDPAELGAITTALAAYLFSTSHQDSKKHLAEMAASLSQMDGETLDALFSAAKRKVEKRKEADRPDGE